MIGLKCRPPIALPASSVEGVARLEVACTFCPSVCHASAPRPVDGHRLVSFSLVPHAELCPSLWLSVAVAAAPFMCDSEYVKVWTTLGWDKEELIAASMTARSDSRCLVNGSQ